MRDDHGHGRPSQCDAKEDGREAEVLVSPGSKSAMCYVAAGNERIKTEGKITFDFESLEGHKESLFLSDRHRQQGAGLWRLHG